MTYRVNRDYVKRVFTVMKNRKKYNVRRVSQRCGVSYGVVSELIGRPSSSKVRMRVSSLLSVAEGMDLDLNLLFEEVRLEAQ